MNLLRKVFQPAKCYTILIKILLGCSIVFRCEVNRTDMGDSDTLEVLDLDGWEFKLKG